MLYEVITPVDFIARNTFKMFDCEDRTPTAYYPLDQFPEKRLHRYFHDYGIRGQAEARSDPQLFDDSHPYIRVDIV